MLQIFGVIYIVLSVALCITVATITTPSEDFLIFFGQVLVWMNAIISPLVILDFIGDK